MSSSFIRLLYIGGHLCCTKRRRPFSESQVKANTRVRFLGVVKTLGSTGVREKQIDGLV